jgi:drug/metabolite transporter (DMT)-like permease
MENKGLILVFLTAIVSGFSIFINKFAIASLNPFIFTTLKNLLVAVFLISLIFVLFEFKNLKKLALKQWLQLAFIGLIGGSIPFLLYFYALKMTSAINAGFIHKTLFIWASIIGFFYLKEKISKKFVVGALMLFAGNFFVFSKISGFGFPDLLILIATIFWATENVFAKKVLKELYGRIVAFGRMFFGSMFMLLFLFFTGQVQGILELSLPQIEWVLLTSFFLFLYVLTYYTGLKYVKVSIATSILLLGQPITALLSLVFLGKTISFNQAIGFFLIVSGIITIVGVSYALQFFKWKGLSIARERN